MESKKQRADADVKKTAKKAPIALVAKVFARDVIAGALVAKLEPSEGSAVIRKSHWLSARQVVYADKRVGAKRTSYYLATAMPNAAGEEGYTRARIRAYQYKDLSAASKEKTETWIVVFRDVEWPKVKIAVHFEAKGDAAAVIVQAEEKRLKEYARESAFGQALELWRITEPQLASEESSESERADERADDQENNQESNQEEGA